MSPEGVSAAMSYKAIVGRVGQAAEDLRVWEQARAAQLDAEIAAAEEAVAAAEAREQRTAQSVHHWWRMAADNVSRLSWLEVSDPPSPAPNAHGAWLDRYLDEVKPAYQDLVDAVLSLGWRARR